jgi:predicted transposase YdaD
MQEHTGMLERTVPVEGRQEGRKEGRKEGRMRKWTETWINGVMKPRSSAI